MTAGRRGGPTGGDVYVCMHVPCLDEGKCVCTRRVMNGIFRRAETVDGEMRVGRGERRSDRPIPWPLTRAKTATEDSRRSPSGNELRCFRATETSQGRAMPAVIFRTAKAKCC